MIKFGMAVGRTLSGDDKVSIVSKFHNLVGCIQGS